MKMLFLSHQTRWHVREGQGYIERKDEEVQEQWEESMVEEEKEFFYESLFDICVTVTVEGDLKVVSICEKRESSESDKCELFVGSTCTSTQTSHTEDKEYFEFFYSLKI